MRKYSQVVSASFAPGTQILPARPERTALFLSVELIVAQPVYVLGRSAADGMVIRVNVGNPSVLLCRDDIDDLVNLPLWNGGTGPLRALVNEEWEKPTGKCVCECVE